MAPIQVKKVVAVCFLEATKTVLDQLGQHRIEMTERGQDCVKEFPQLYGDVRRMRDYLQRCIGANPENVVLDLEPEDLTVLAACCRRAFEAIDHKLEGSGLRLSEQEREWLARKRQTCADWAVEFAQKPLLELPLPRLSPTPTIGLKGLNQRLNHKLFGPKAAAAPMGFESFRGAPGSGLAAADSRVIHDEVDKVEVRVPVASRPAPMAAPRSETPVDEPGAVLGKGVDAVPVTGLGGMLLDVRQVRDPRLRALLSLDQRAYERAIAAKDWRLAAVHLASVLEGAVLDHAIPRRAELGLAGPADTWNAQDIVLRVLGDRCEPKDRSFVFHVFAARNLLRPAAQLVSPMVVTQQSLDRLVEFTVRALRQMGFQGGTDVGSSGFVPREFGIPGAGSAS